MAIIILLLIFMIYAYYSVEHDVENLQYTFSNVSYMGGHPQANVSTKYGILYVSENNVSFCYADNSENILEIPIQKIKNCTIETKESLTMSSKVGNFAGDLKRSKEYIRIEFKYKHSDLQNVILYSSITPSISIIGAINETRINYIKNRRFERGEV